MATSYYFWETSKSGFAKREGKNGLLMHAPISAMFSFFFLPLFFCLSFFLSHSFSPFLLLLVSDYYLVVDCFSPLDIFPFDPSLPGSYLLSYNEFFSLHL